MRRVAPILAFFVAAVVVVALTPAERAARAEEPIKRRCPSEMVLAQEACVDRWEVSLVDHKTQKPLSPYYPPNATEALDVEDYWRFAAGLYGDAAAQSLPLPELPAWQRERFQVRAVSRPGVVPQAYMTYYDAKRACENAGKRLCTEKEWVVACGGEHARKFPYGEKYATWSCNVFRNHHPAFVLHRNSSLGHRDPRLNLLFEGTDPLLRLTGATPRCASTWGNESLWDMVGNLDEWVEGEKGPAFVGGFYSRSTNKGCEAKVDVHGPAYYDYSTGARCCKNPIN